MEPSDEAQVLNMISDLSDWKSERHAVALEISKLTDRLEGLDDDISNTHDSLRDYIEQVTDPE